MRLALQNYNELSIYCMWFNFYIQLILRASTLQAYENMQYYNGKYYPIDKPPISYLDIQS